MGKEENKNSIQEKLESLIEKNKNEAGALKKIIKAIEQEHKKSNIKPKK